MERRDPAGGAIGQPIGQSLTRWSLRYGIALLLLAATACASRSDLASATLAEGGVAVIGAGYRFVATRYIRPVSIRTVALSGLDGMAKIDPRARAVAADGGIAVRYDGATLAGLEQPPDDDIRGWAAVTVRAFAAAGRVSVKIRDARPDEIYRAVFRAAFAPLDRYSRYVAPAEARENRALREGYGGIGVTVRAENGLTRVVSVMPGAPGDKAGLKDDDIIAAVAGQPIRGMSLKDIVRRLRGPRGTRVQLTVRRATRKQPLTVQVTRAFIVPQTVIARRAGNAAYLRITRFGDDTAREAEDKLVALRTAIGSRRMSGAILDLRDNAGGLLDQAVRLSDLFLDDGEIVQSRGRHPGSRRRYDARYGDILYGKPLVVLVNGRTASSSEVMAAALQDNGRAILVGSGSFGKGTVQSIATLPNGGEIVLTWARLHAPSGYTMQGLGVKPNVCTAAGRPDAAARSNAAARRALDRLDAGADAPVEAFRAWRRHGVPEEDVSRPLRAACPARAMNGARDSDMPDIDMEVARRLLADTRLYRQAAALAAREPAGRPDREQADDEEYDMTDQR